MIWNERMLFLHTPKTAGMSMTRMLLGSLLGHMFTTGTSSRKGADAERRVRGQLRKKLVAEGSEEAAGIGITHLSGTRHETLYEAEALLMYRNKSVRDFQRVFSVIRNPYDLELSRYSYLRKGLAVDRGPAQDIALRGSLRDYLLDAPLFGMSPPRLFSYIIVNNAIPENLTVLRFERLSRDIATYMAPYLSPGYTLPHENRSKHSAYREEYDAECEELCFHRHRWFFEKGFYEREALGNS